MRTRDYYQSTLVVLLLRGIYSLAKKTTVASSTAQVYQFPVVVCFAATTHKFQGGTIIKPNKLAVDLRTVFYEAMAYVRLSRVQDILQLYIVGDLPEHKFRVSSKCLKELDKLWQRSVNVKLSHWEQMSESIKIDVLNIHSLLDKSVDFKDDEFLKFSDVICLTETWQKDDEWKSDLDISGYKQHFNSWGNERGKGLAVYYKEEKFRVSGMYKSRYLQVSHLSSREVDVIALYRSSDCKDALQHIVQMIDLRKTVIICGDSNICYTKSKSNGLIKSLLELGFEQRVSEATHIEGGLIDHVYLRNGGEPFHSEVSLYSPYYTALDHDALCVTLKKKTD